MRNTTSSNFYRVTGSELKHSGRESLKKVNERLLKSIYKDPNLEPTDNEYMTRIQSYRKSLTVSRHKEEIEEIEKFELIKDFRETEANLLKELREVKSELYELRRKEKKFEKLMKGNTAEESNIALSKLILNKESRFDEEANLMKLSEAEKIVKKLRKENFDLKSRINLLVQNSNGYKKKIAYLEQEIHFKNSSSQVEKRFNCLKNRSLICSTNLKKRMRN